MCIRDSAVGDTGTIVVTVTVGTGVTQTFTNTVVIATDTPEWDYTNNDDDEPTDVVVDNETDVTIAKSDNPDPVAPGGQLVYTLVYANSGLAPAENVVVSDTLPPEVTFVAASPIPNAGPPNPLLWNLDTLNAGARGTIVVTVTVGPDVTETFTNPVEITTTTPESNYENNDDEEPTDVLLADVMIVKTADTDMISPGTEFKYELEYSNIGALTATDVVVFDILPPELIFGEATPEQDEGPNPLVWNVGTLAPGQGDTITLTVTVRPDVTSEWITNTAVISTTTPETRYDNNRSSVDRPTAVEMLYYWAKPVPEGVLLKWETAWEIDSYGFAVLRSNSGRLSDASEVAFVPAAGRGQGGGAAYSYLDRLEAGAIGREYTYWLAAVDTNGQRTMYGPMPVSAARMSRLYGLPEAAVVPYPYG